MSLRMFFVISAIFLMSAESIEAKTELVIPGTGDSQALLRILAVEFGKNNPDFHVEIPESTGSGGGVKAVGKGNSEMGRVARPPKATEEKYNLEYQVFAISPVVFVVNGDVGVSNLSSSQVVSIFDGSVTNWQELGGQDTELYIVQRESGDSSRSVLEENLPGFKDILKYAGKVVYSTPETVATILENTSTLGYAPLSSVNKKGLKILKYENLNPLDQDDEAKYPLVTPLGLVWKKGGLSKGMAMFKDFLFSKQARAIIADFGAIPARN